MMRSILSRKFHTSVARQAKVLCVLYPDPVNGYPPPYARDSIPKITGYIDGQTTPTPSAIDFVPGQLLGSVSGELGLRKVRLYSRWRLALFQSALQRLVFVLISFWKIVVTPWSSPRTRMVPTRRWSASSRMRTLSSRSPFTRRILRRNALRKRRNSKCASPLALALTTSI